MDLNRERRDVAWDCWVQGRSFTHSLVGRGTSRHRALGTAVARVARVHNGDLVRGRSTGRSARGHRGRRSEDREEKGNEVGVHVYC